MTELPQSTSCASNLVTASAAREHPELRMGSRLAPFLVFVWGVGMDWARAACRHLFIKMFLSHLASWFKVGYNDT